jgi:hypothetical protein
VVLAVVAVVLAVVEVDDDVVAVSVVAVDDPVDPALPSRLTSDASSNSQAAPRRRKAKIATRCILASTHRCKSGVELTSDRRDRQRW